MSSFHELAVHGCSKRKCRPSSSCRFAAAMLTSRCRLPSTLRASRSSMVFLMSNRAEKNSHSA
eukprot:15865486-Heterocapsa_arctica.AAC.1